MPSADSDRIDLIRAVPNNRRASLTLADDPISAAAADLPAGAIAEPHHNPLKRTLTALDLTLLGISGIVGAGIYVLTGAASALYAGPAVTISFIIAAVCCSFSCLCYSELASLLPVAGSAYSFSTATLGPFVGWLIGWDLCLEYLVGVATVAVGWSGYCSSMLADIGLDLPQSLRQGPLTWDVEEERWKSTGGVFNLPAVVIIGVLAAVNYVGIQESARFTRVVVGAKVLVLLVFILVGAFYVNSDNWKPFVPPAGDKFGEYGVTGILRASSVLFFSFIGADSVSTAAQEAVNPQRDVPIATLASLGICSLLYIAVGLVLTGLVSYKSLNVSDPIAVAVNALGPDMLWLRAVVKIGGLLGLTSVIMVLILGQSRVWYSMSHDGNLPPLLSRVHTKYRTPHVAVLLCALVASVMAAVVPIDVLGEMVSIGTLLAFVLVCAGVLVLRRTKPHLHRPFKTPLVPWVPILGIVTASLQMLFLPWGTWVRLIAWLLVGLAVYHFYSRKHMKPLEERMVMLIGMQAASAMMQAERQGQAEAGDLQETISPAAVTNTKGSLIGNGGAGDDNDAWDKELTVPAKAKPTRQDPGVVRPSTAAVPSAAAASAIVAPPGVHVGSSAPIPRARQAVASASLFAAQSDIGLLPVVPHRPHETVTGRDFAENIHALEYSFSDASSSSSSAPASALPHLPIPAILHPKGADADDRSPAVIGLLAEPANDFSPVPPASVAHADAEADGALMHVADAAVAVVSPSGKLVSPGAEASAGSGFIGSISRRLSKVGGRRSRTSSSASGDANSAFSHRSGFGAGEAEGGDPFGVHGDEGGHDADAAERPADARRQRRPSIAETVASIAAQVVTAVDTAVAKGRARSRANSAAAESAAHSAAVAAASEVMTTLEHHEHDHEHGHDTTHSMASVGAPSSTHNPFEAVAGEAGNSNTEFEFSPPPQPTAAAAPGPSAEATADGQKEEWW